MPLIPGRRFGEYDIVARLGAGGMGEVWRAWDPRLERHVALKVLSVVAVTDETARSRLLREARMAARLNHPHICTIHEVGEAEDQTYLTMELVAGQTLSERLRSGQLPLDEVIRLGLQLTDALAHAHDRGVVHRDLKSANIVITPQGRATVLDFGLAKEIARTEPEMTTLTGASLTAPGALIGTVAYMAPEQLRGRPADARSDLWALGVVLHEMACGVCPFSGSTVFELSSAILNQPSPRLPADHGGVPPAPLQVVIDRCLEKDPGRRYQRASEVRMALETAQTMASSQSAAPAPDQHHHGDGHEQHRELGPVRKSSSSRPSADQGPIVSIRLAVLPFANLTGNPEQEYLVDGVTQEMISQLGRLHPEGLSVIARCSVMRYKESDTPVDQVGRELKVDYILEGSARRGGQRMRITAELIRVEDQTLMWAESYDSELANILELQSEVAERVAESLALELLPAERARLASAPAVDPEAHDAYLKGCYHTQKTTPPDLDIAERYFGLALERDPSYVAAYEGLAFLWMVRQQMGITPPREAGPKLRAAALRAIELDDRSALAHMAMAFVMMCTDWDWEGADVEWQRSLELNPNAADAHAFFAHFLIMVGRTAEALSHSDRSIELDPFNPLLHSLRAMVLYAGRRYEEAIAAARAALAIQPDSPTAWNTLQQLFVSMGMRDELLAARRQRIAHDPELLAAFEQGLAESDHEGAHRRVADLLAERYADGGGGDAFGVARRYIDAGDCGRAIDWLERAYDERDPNLPYIAALPFYDPLRDDPRFQDLIRRLNLQVTGAGADHPDEL